MSDMTNAERFLNYLHITSMDDPEEEGDPLLSAMKTFKETIAVSFRITDWVAAFDFPEEAFRGGAILLFGDFSYLVIALAEANGGHMLSTSQGRMSEFKTPSAMCRAMCPMSVDARNSLETFERVESFLGTDHGLTVEKLQEMMA